MTIPKKLEETFKKLPIWYRPGTTNPRTMREAGLPYREDYKVINLVWKNKCKPKLREYNIIKEAILKHYDIIKVIQSEYLNQIIFFVD